MYYVAGPWQGAHAPYDRAAPDGTGCAPRPRRRALPWLMLLGLTTGSGCSSDPPLPPLFPVTGTVTVDGVPLTSGNVSLVPVVVEEGKTAAASSSGQIDGSGNYTIFTGGHAGAPQGKFKVGVTPSMVPQEGVKGMPKAPFHDRFRDPNKSQLSIDVVPGGGPYDLQLLKK